MTVSASAPLNVVMSYFRAVDEGDIDAALELFAPDATYRRSRDVLLEGRGHIEHFFRHERGIASIEHTIDHAAVAGEVVLIEGRFEATTDRGDRLSLSFADVWEVRSGAVVARRSYPLA